VKTFFGMQPIHMLYERSTWHSAQHARQLAAVLERLGIEPDGRLTAEDLAGLPLPERLWE
ncbi:MAG: NrdH-redoxin, partial [Pseudomonadota bacterium]